MNWRIFLFVHLAWLAPGGSYACGLSADWTRFGDPVMRDPLVGVSYTYEVASDPHVFSSESGLFMVYTGDDSDVVSIKMGRGTAEDIWRPDMILLGPSTGHPAPIFKETPFYRETPRGEHQIYFIGYDDEDTYQSQIYLATSDALTGPYSIRPDPIIRRGLIAGRQVALMTSPSVVEHQGRLYIAFLGWDSFSDVREVWAFGAVSDDDGLTWHDFREVAVPIGMEGQVSAAPDGGFVAARTGEFGSGEAIFASCSDHPFGPYSDETMILSQAGAPWETDEIIGAQIFFDPSTGAPLLYYTGADHQTGWWIMLARPSQ